MSLELLVNNTRNFLARFDVLRQAHSKWELANFGPQLAKRPLIGVVEELGELSFTMLKFSQGIRGVDAIKYLADGRDALGDIGIYFISFVNKILPDGFVITEQDMLRVYGTDYWMHIPLTQLREDFDPTYAVDCDVVWTCYSSLHNDVNNLFRAHRLHMQSTDKLDNALLGIIISLFRSLSTLSVSGFNAQYIDLLEGTWDSVISKRDWKKDPEGLEAATH